MASSTETSGAPSRKKVRRAQQAGFLGTLVEAYDFFVYTYLVLYTAPLFFPADNPTSGVLASLLTLGAGFLARPIGGLVFGWMGDRRGRRFTLLVTVTMMGGATLLIGLLPTYQQVGVLAPVLLVVVRLLQGFSAGGELMGAATYVSEHSSKGNRGRLSSVTPLGFTAGTVLAPAVVALVTLLVGPASMGSWGWRVPLLLSLPLAVLCLALRSRLDDSPEFEKLAEEQALARTPVREVVRHHFPALIRVILLGAVVLLSGYVVAGYVPVFLQQQAGIAPGTAATMAAVANCVGIPVVFAAGLLIDRIGKRPVMVLLLGTLTVVALPALMLIKHSGGVWILVVVAFAVLAALASSSSVPAYAAFTGLFPARVRYTGAAFGFGLGSALGAGFGPYLAAQLSVSTGNIYAPAFLMMGVSVIGIVVILTTPNTDAGADVPDTLAAGVDARPQP
ncbi:glycine betaine/L-proline transporter ProP [Pseudonocardia ailaonensis]|uniref:Glycine betaine/L-proline transporter ProP n=1 Tax=Pseudonocardia ailaonensis TaxID=367279 RepID=A0ABN2MYC7_9PSEU